MFSFLTKESMITPLHPTFIANSNIDCVAHSGGSLFIRFQSGEAYSYDGVPYDHFDALQKVESAGKFFSSLHPRQISLHEVVARSVYGGAKEMKTAAHKTRLGFVLPI